MKRKLTQKQKALRYDYIEKAILELLDNKIDNVRENESKSYTPASDIVDSWMEDVDRYDNVIPKKLFCLFDRVCNENFFTYVSYDNLSDYAEMFGEMNEEIGD